MSRLMISTPREHPFPWVIISRVVDEGGTPHFDQHTLAEAAQTKEAALLYAERRAEQGYWVEVYREHYYYAPRHPNKPIEEEQQS